MNGKTLIASAFGLVALALTMVDLHGPRTPPSAAGPGDTADTAAADGGPRQPHAPPQPGEVRQMSIKHLGNFKYDPQNSANIPADVKQLNGMNVRLSGFMIPMDQSSQITQFTLVPSLWTCCYGKPPQVQHTIVVECPPGKSVGYVARPVVVEGKLSVGTTTEDGYVVSLFRLVCDSVQPAPDQP